MKKVNILNYMILATICVPIVAEDCGRQYTFKNLTTKWVSFRPVTAARCRSMDVITLAPQGFAGFNVNKHSLATTRTKNQMETTFPQKMQHDDVNYVNWPTIDYIQYWSACCEWHIDVAQDMGKKTGYFQALGNDSWWANTINHNNNGFYSYQDISGVSGTDYAFDWDDDFNAIMLHQYDPNTGAKLRVPLR